ncbi:MAG: carboxymuconolactone decarboxylase family protein [Novosphingobium sp.]|nr:carboxymuconolactone decarboxylase family protein [Novosphingobium sp.]
MSEHEVRITPLAPEQFTPEQAELVGDWTHLVFSRVVVHHPGAYRNFVPHIKALIAEGKIPPRDREIVVLCMLGLCDETYETHHHRTIAATNTGMSDAEIDAALAGEGVCLSDFDRVLIRATQELLRDQKVSNETWAALGERYSDEQKMEVVFLAGLYATMAMLTKSFGMPLEGESEDYERIQSLRDYG